MLLPLLLATADQDFDPMTCRVEDHNIVVVFPRTVVREIRKFAVVQSGELRRGKRVIIIDDDMKPLSPYRPGVRKLVIDTRQQAAVSWQDGKAWLVKAFPAGRSDYQLVFSDNLETEIDNMTLYTCRVRLAEKTGR